ncbi:hypothetical protein GQX73_g4070 [Xylaria multiplex]|uniref:Wax synthase domain-containing protein n=1 Tax=Xylaria multiplex TaxID=323545 RepID=A0A7C8IUL8_9PEZI|nr:hypothetical protein GQX73_g4070 [Xylaria multiplex]
MSPQQRLPDLASVYRELYRAKFRADVRDGAATPFVVPLHLLAYWIVPTLYLTIPHRNRPWLYHARWLVLGFVCAFNWYLVRHVRSISFASSYGVGLLGAWTTIWTFTLLIWTRPQWDARRVERREIMRHVDEVGNRQEIGQSPTSSQNGRLSKLNIDKPNDQSSTLLRNCGTRLQLESHDSPSVTVTRRVQRNGDEVANGVRKKEAHTIKDIGDETEDSLLARSIVALNDSDGNPPLDQNMALELSRLTQEREYEYYWQEYPADASFWTRLGWAFDLVSSFRLTGWNWAPSCLPPYNPPPRIGQYQLPLEYGPHRSRRGYERTLSRAKLIIFRWVFNIIPSYIILDICATLMTMDPYFIIGPEHNHPLPTHLALLHPILLSLQRTTLAFVAIVIALQYALNFGAVLLALYCPPILGFRAHPWHLPSPTGSFTQVLDHGLSGFWGAWWHQTFRFGFSAPTKWLIRHGYVPPPQRSGGVGGAIITPLIGAIIAFALSGLVHGAGSYTSVPATYYWGPPLFFAFSGLGMISQSVFLHLLRHRTEKLPRWVCRLANLTFVILWLWATSWLLLDDFGRSGLWLWEPVPISFARAAGLGVDRYVWRYHRDSLPRWQWGARGRWWETGIVV